MAVETTQAKYLRVLVDGVDSQDGRPVHVNVKLPLGLLKAGLKLTTLMPSEAQTRVNEALHEKGVDIDVRNLKPEDVDELIAELRDVTIDVDHPGDPEHPNEQVKVRIFAE